MMNRFPSIACTWMAFGAITLAAPCTSCPLTVYGVLPAFVAGGATTGCRAIVAEFR